VPAARVDTGMGGHWPCALRHGSWPGLAGIHALISRHSPHVLVSASGPAPRYKSRCYQLRSRRLHLQRLPTLHQVDTALRKHTRTASSAPSPVHPVPNLLRRPQPSRSLQPLHRAPADYKSHEGPRCQDCLSLYRPKRQGPSFSTTSFWILRPSPQEQVTSSISPSVFPPPSPLSYAGRGFIGP